VIGKIEELIQRYPLLSSNQGEIYKAYELMKTSYEDRGKLLVAGNGGSASDAEHIVGELMKGFKLPRRMDEALGERFIAIDDACGAELADKLQNALPAIALTSHTSLNTAFLNDVDGKLCFAQQVNGYGMKGDVFMAMSTSGNSENILYAAITAKAKGLKVIGLTGKGGGKLASLADVMIAVDEEETYRAQELHVPVYHCLCLMLEEYFFGK
jgi:Phosphoheptose isomerase